MAIVWLEWSVCCRSRGNSRWAAGAQKEKGNILHTHAQTEREREIFLYFYHNIKFLGNYLLIIVIFICFGIKFDRYSNT